MESPPVWGHGWHPAEDSVLSYMHKTVMNDGNDVRPGDGARGHCLPMLVLNRVSGSVPL